MNLEDVLFQPIPDFEGDRKVKTGYREHPILTIGAHDDEPLVNIEEYGIAGQSYYSRPNNLTDDPIPGIEPAIYVRKSIAEKLAAINYELQNCAAIEKLFGRRVELYINEGYRSPELQKKLYEEVFPYILSQQHPDWTKAQLTKRRDELSAKPPEEGAPSPHATGAAVDLNFRYADQNPGYVPGTEINFGSNIARAEGISAPDYFEHLKKMTAEQREAQKNRRIFFWTMRGALNGDDSGLMVNPTEWWHWSYGDQMWAKLTKAPEAFYGLAKAD
jgi:D-alanyl-D-alanine dipeptidase